MCQRRSPKQSKLAYGTPKQGPGPGIPDLDLGAPAQTSSRVLFAGGDSDSDSSEESSVDGTTSESDNNDEDSEQSQSPSAMSKSKSMPELSKNGAVQTPPPLEVAEESSVSSLSRSPSLQPRSVVAELHDPDGGGGGSRYREEFDEKRRLGKGGQGTVFVAHRNLDGIDYAVKKVLLPRAEKDRDRVLREVKSLAQLEHINIVRYYNAWIENTRRGDLDAMFHPPSPHGREGSHSGGMSMSFTDTSFMGAPRESEDMIREVLFIQMKLYEQETLQQYLAPGARSAVDEGDAFVIVQQILSGLAYVHNEGLIHRDLKPANIFRSRNSHGETEWKIGDFGLSKSALSAVQGDGGVAGGGEASFVLPSLPEDELTRQDTSEVGTTLYASPEQSSQSDWDLSEKTDMFSIGVILVELFVPFSTMMHRSASHFAALRMRPSADLWCCGAGGMS